MLRLARSTPISFLTAALLGAAFAPFGQDLCQHKSVTAPDPLTGVQAGGAESEYAFRHVSDVDKPKDIATFTYLIHNDNRERLLPVEWLNGRGEYVLRFERLAPSGYACNHFDSYQRHIVDSKALIKYGPTTQHQKPAEIYDRPDATRGEATREGELRSVLSADLLDAENQILPLRLLLTSRVSGSNVEYVISNTSSKPQMFSIPVLSAAWEADIPGIEIKLRWPGRERRGEVDEYTIPADQRATFEVSVPSSVALAPQIASLQVRGPGGSGIAIGRVAVHLPVRR